MPSVGAAVVAAHQRSRRCGTRTAAFPHGGWDHIPADMLFLAILGKNVEDAFGSLGYLVFYFAGGFVAMMTQTVMTLLFGSALATGEHGRIAPRRLGLQSGLTLAAEAPQPGQLGVELVAKQDGHAGKVGPQHGRDHGADRPADDHHPLVVDDQPGGRSPAEG